jgi:hypothetical protein
MFVTGVQTCALSDLPQCNDDELLCLMADWMVLEGRYGDLSYRIYVGRGFFSYKHFKLQYVWAILWMPTIMGHRSIDPK